jgi:hypothetical protein
MPVAQPMLDAANQEVELPRSEAGDWVGLERHCPTLHVNVQRAVVERRHGISGHGTNLLALWSKPSLLGETSCLSSMA